MKLDVLAFAAHPDDVELSCSGTLAKLKSEGKKLGVVDLTQGELGSRGSAELRAIEAKKSSEILGLDTRVNLKMADGFFEVNEANKLLIIEQVRRFKPEIVLANAVNDRHIDHGRGAKLVAEACFLSGLKKIETKWEAKPQEHWRPKAVYHYIQDYHIKPDVVIDITPFWSQKLQSIMAFSSQFFDPDSTEPETPISSKDFVDFLEARSREMGRPIGATYGEGFTVQRPIGVKSLLDLV